MLETMSAHPAKTLTEAYGPRLCHLDAASVGPVSEWAAVLAQTATCGFTHVVIAPPFRTAPRGNPLRSATHSELHPALQWDGHADDGLREIVRIARAAGLGTMLDVVLPVVAADGDLARLANSPFCVRDQTLDPTRFDPEGEGAWARTDTQSLPRLTGFWQQQLCHWASLGLGGFRLIGLDKLPAPFVASLAQALAGTGARLLGWMPGIPMPRLASFIGSGLDFVFSSFPWWDGEADWFWREAASLAPIAPILHASHEPVFGKPVAVPTTRHARLNLAALLGSGWLYPGKTVADDAAQVTALNKARRSQLAFGGRTPAQPLYYRAGQLAAALRLSGPDARVPGPATLVMLAEPGSEIDPPQFLDALGGYYPLGASLREPLQMPPEGFCVVALDWQKPLCPSGVPDLTLATQKGRIAIERVSPAVDSGKFPARRVLGERVRVEADLIADGHGIIAARLQTTSPDGRHQELLMTPAGNDRWAAEFVPDQIGRWHFKILAWPDRYETYCDELAKKIAAGIDISLELLEGTTLLRQAFVRGSSVLGPMLVADVDAMMLLSTQTRALMAE
ncbi:MAG: DUF3416 domain-containing protein, partial [Acidocella sp.]|nr:DUF3416 domain-containing protein [Acidocella sp.]